MCVCDVSDVCDMCMLMHVHSTVTEEETSEGGLPCELVLDKRTLPLPTVRHNLLPTMRR